MFFESLTPYRWYLLWLGLILILIPPAYLLYEYLFKGTKRISLAEWFTKRGEIIVELSTGGRRSQEPEASILITNLIKQPFTVNRVLTKEKGNSLVELSTQDFNLPQTIKYQDTISLPSPYIAHNIDKLEIICVEDTQGKRLDVNKKSLEQAKKLLRNFIGNRLTFPSMGDEVDEDKIT